MPNHDSQPRGSMSRPSAGGTASNNAGKMRRGRPFEPGHPGGPGRPRGAKNRETVKRQLIAETGFDALVFLTSVAEDDSQDIKVRIDCAKAILDRTYPRLAATHLTQSEEMSHDEWVRYFEAECSSEHFGHQGGEASAGNAVPDGRPAEDIP